MKPWQIVVIAVSGVLLALALFAPSVAFVSLTALLPLFLSLAWAVAVLVYLHGIREELRGLRRDQAASVVQEAETLSE